MKTLFKYISMLMIFMHAHNAFTQNINITEPQIPILTNMKDNILLEVKIDNSKGDSRIINNLSLEILPGNLNFIKSVKLYYSGTNSVLLSNTSSNAIKINKNIYGSGGRLYSDSNHSILLNQINNPTDISNITFTIDRALVTGNNYFFITLDVNHDADLLETFNFILNDIEIDNISIKPDYVSQPIRRLGYGLRNHGDDGAFAYRIPGIVSTDKGTLVAVYDIRHDNSSDLQGYVDVGVSRSLDGGQTWLTMDTIIDMGMYGALPEAQNGVGDAAVLYDDETGRLWVAGLWAHGFGGTAIWHNSKRGIEPYETGQTLLVYSDDDGATWSEPQNITRQVKDTSWRLFFQGPGRGITMSNGTLVFACQHIDSTGMPYSGIMFSTDKGKTWTSRHTDYPNTTESQVVELTPGVLMLNMRDNRGGTRAVYTTTDMGETWQEHSSSRSLLTDPVCMASLIKIKAEDNIFNKDIILFSNPNSESARRDITVKISYDNGTTWDDKTILLDSEYGWGYSCLCRIDKSTIGIIYEGSTSHLVFQKIKLSEFKY